MPDQTPTADLQALVAPIAAALLPGWTVSATWVTQAELDADIPGALAICSPTPTRQLAKIRAVSPWPASESLAETLWHELTHALLSPLTALIPASDGAVMVEEQAVERLGVLLSKLGTSARRAVLRGVSEYGTAHLRARIAALAPRARSGGGTSMDPETLKKMIAAIKSGDGDAALQMCEEALVKAASGGAAPALPAGEPDGDEAREAGNPGAPIDDTGAPPPGKPTPPPEARSAAKVEETKPGAPPAVGRSVARKGADVGDIETMRARKAAQDAATEVEAIATAMRPAAKEALVIGLRARLGSALTPNAEKRIMAAATFQAAQAVADLVIDLAPSAEQRARSGVEHGASAPDAAAAKAVAEADLIKEGFAPRWIAEYHAAAKRDPMEGMALLEGGRDGLVSRRARIASDAAKAVAS